MKRILIVEDNPDILAAIADLLEGEGYSVTPAPSAEVALDLLFDPSTLAFNVIILDNFMPGLNGQEFIERLASPGAPLTTIPPLLLITTNPEFIQAAHLPVRVTLLPKPLDITRLIEIVESLTA